MKSVVLLLGGVLLSGLLLAFALPPHGWATLGWIVFVPALLGVRKRGFAVGFGSGVVIGLVAAFIDAKGFLLSGNVPDGSTDWIYTGFLLFSLVIGMALGVWGASEKLAAKPWAMAAWAVLFEAMLLLYLPANMALTQSRSTSMLYLSSWTGIWGVSYLVWLVNFWFLSARPKWLWALVVGAIVLSIPGPFPMSRGDVRIGMIQTQTFEKDQLEKLNAQAGKTGAILSVWPELSGEIDVPDRKVTELLSVAKAPDQPAFITTLQEDGNPKPYNVAHIFSGEGISAGYRKRKPFSGEAQMHAAGRTPAAVTVGGVTYGMNICFDSCFPSIMRDTARLPNVDVILLPTLDPPTSFGVVQAIHAAYTPFRAAELGVPIVRSDITAYSMAVDSYGRVISIAGCEQDHVLYADISPGKRWTFVTWAGDWFLWLAGFVALASLLSKKQMLPKDPITE